MAGKYGRHNFVVMNEPMSESIAFPSNSLVNIREVSIRINRLGESYSHFSFNLFASIIFESAIRHRLIKESKVYALKVEVKPCCDEEYTMSLLWNAHIFSFEKFVANGISEISELSMYFLHIIPSISKKETFYILDNNHLRTEFCNRLYKNEGEVVERLKFLSFFESFFFSPGFFSLPSH